MTKETKQAFDDRFAQEMTEAAEGMRLVGVTIPADDWETFEAWAKRAPQTNPALCELLALKPTWER